MSNVSSQKSLWEKIKDFFHTPAIQKWLEDATSNLKKILFSPEAVNFYLSLIATALSITIPEAQTLWNIILNLVRSSDKAYPEPNTGGEKYKLAYDTFQKGNYRLQTTGEKVDDFRFDYILHLALAYDKKTKELKNQETALKEKKNG